MKLTIMKSQIGDESDLDKAGYIYEPKLDGFRALCYINTSVTFVSRNDNDLTKRFPELTSIRPYVQAKSCILDGEIVAYNQQGFPDFSLLKESHATHYVAFDILMKDGVSLLDKPLIERKKILDETIKDGGHLQKMVFTHNGRALWKEVKKLHLEGIVAKDEQSRYYPGVRHRSWLKIKYTQTIECIIVGFAYGRRVIRSLALGLYNRKNELVYIGSVGTGFSATVLQQLYKKLQPLSITNPPVINPPRTKIIQWVRPRLVCEIKYLEFTPYTILRSSVFLRLRSDKNPYECTFQDQGLLGIEN